MIWLGREELVDAQRAAEERALERFVETCTCEDVARPERACPVHGDPELGGAGWRFATRP